MIVLDTNVISEMMRSRPEPAVFDWINVHNVTSSVQRAPTSPKFFMAFAQCRPAGGELVSSSPRN